ncbi:DUF4157 domain-containing protein [Halogeometricum sp. CBA1124]|nr:DUF4157 domain-containing protein [Halogeometricum sp. CBA1124]MUV57941.1 DUF4157 domain-containing protein [Halogeometricum sp. CBA1124]
MTPTRSERSNKRSRAGHSRRPRQNATGGREWTAGSREHPLLYVQRSRGNRAARRLVDERIQPTLAVGRPDDRYEREAERVAERVVKTDDIATPRDGRGASEVCPAADSPTVRRVTGSDGTGDAPSVVGDVLRSPGRPLDAGLRTAMERRFGHDFGDVRLHTDSRAASSARHLDARAYTVGQDIVFGDGEYRPGAAAGRRLVAHELVHTVQQQGAPDAAQPNEITPSVRSVRRQESEWQRDVVEGRHYYYDTRAEAEARRPAARTAHGWTETRIDAIEIRGETRYHVVGRAAGSRTPAREDPEPTGEPSPESQQRRRQQQPQASGPTPMRVAGQDPPANDYRVIRIAWTLDDGPTAYTSGMQRALGGTPGTWFIMRNLLGTGAELQRSLQQLARLQSQGQEIAIHSMHPDIAHAAWFPVQVSGSVPKAYDTIGEAIRDLEAFVTQLRNNNITVNFVRLPGGLISELKAYLRAKGLSGDASDRVARKIVAGQTLSGEPAGAQEVHRDYQALTAALSRNGLHLWGGGAGRSEIAVQSWEAESSGSGLTDNVTTTFRGLVDNFRTVHRPRSLVILAHDTNQNNAEEVGRDIRAMEAYARQNGVKVEYYTMSQLYQVVRGEQP